MVYIPDQRDKRRPFEIVPIERVDVYESVLEQLNSLIRESGMEPGDKLPPERELVERLQVSRVVIREALRALESMGKIEIRPNMGSFLIHPNGNALVGQLKSVHPINTSFLEYLVDVRAAVEDKVVTKVAVLVEAGNDLILTSVKEVLDREKTQLGERVEAGSLDLRFEAELGRNSGNPLLQELQRSVHRLWVEAWSECGITPGDHRKLHEEHQAVYDALTNGNSDLTRQLMAEHVDRTIAKAVPTNRGSY